MPRVDEVIKRSGQLVGGKRLAQLIDFENRDAIFPAVHRSFKFSLLTIGWEVKEASFAFFLTDVHQLADFERRFTLSVDDIARINPNTKTAPVFRSRSDAELTSKIYARSPVLLNEIGGQGRDSWNVRFHTRIWHMAEDSQWFRTAGQLREAGFVRKGMIWLPPDGKRPPQAVLSLAGGKDRQSGATPTQLQKYVPLYEAKMIHQFDHRWATYDGNDARDSKEVEKQDANFEPEPRYWVPEQEVANRLHELNWRQKWLFGWRETTNATNERTLIADFIPAVGCGHKFPLIFPEAEPQLCAALCASMNSLACDFAGRQKIGGTSLSLSILKQFPIISPSTYRLADSLAFIVQRVVALTYTSHSMAQFARDLSYEGAPFTWNEEHRAQLRAELDAWYARPYGLTRDELRYVLDPADLKGPDYPSETFRVLKKNEIARFGEYRTARLVLAAYDRLASQPVAAE